MNFTRNCLSYWYPRLEGLPTPATRIIKPEGGFDGFGWCWDGIPPANLPALLDEIQFAVEKVGYPAFLRTGQTSAKHEWENTCYITPESSLEEHVGRICLYSAMVDFMGLPTDVWVVREFLQLKHAFKAFDGMPIAREFRFFVSHGAIVWEQPYWPEAALVGYVEPQARSWQIYLQDISRLDFTDVMEARLLAIEVADRFKDDGAWSIDVCQTVDDKWYVTDMAEAANSYMFDPSTGSETDFKRLFPTLC